jgi:hypothetical protein
VGVEGRRTESFFGKKPKQRDWVDLDEDRSYDLRGWYDSWSTSASIPWCAFLFDAYHRVLPVRGGVRVTAIYQLRHGGGGITTDVFVGPPHPHRVPGSAEDKIQTLVVYPGVYPANSTSPSSIKSAHRKPPTATNNLQAALLVESRETSVSLGDDKQQDPVSLSSCEQREKQHFVLKSQRRTVAVVPANKREISDDAKAEKLHWLHDDIRSSIFSRGSKNWGRRRTTRWLLPLATVIVANRRVELYRVSFDCVRSFEAHM